MSYFFFVDGSGPPSGRQIRGVLLTSVILLDDFPSEKTSIEFRMFQLATCDSPIKKSHQIPSPIRKWMLELCVPLVMSLQSHHIP